MKEKNTLKKLNPYKKNIRVKVLDFDNIEI